MRSLLKFLKRNWGIALVTLGAIASIILLIILLQSYVDTTITNTINKHDNTTKIIRQKNDSDLEAQIQSLKAQLNAKGISIKTLGSPGLAGKNGTVGLTGATGGVGAKGSQGLQGSQGPAGPQGKQGPEGPPGPQGLRGLIGPPGPVGTIVCRLSAVICRALGL